MTGSEHTEYSSYPHYPQALAMQLSPFVIVEMATEADWQTQLIAAESQYVERAVEKRRREFAAGRHTARRALEQLDIRDFALKVGASREPLWPDDIVGSITHSDHCCMVAIAKKDTHLAIGIDIERNTELDTATSGLILTPQEQAHVAELKLNYEFIAWDKLIFSIKECVHKCYFPVNRHYLDFLDAEVTIDPNSAMADIAILKPAEHASTPILQLSARFYADSDHVISSIEILSGSIG